MAKVIVAFAGEAKCAQYAKALEEAGYPVFRLCTSAGAVKRTLATCGDAVVVCSCRLPDATADELAWDLDAGAALLVIGRPDQLALCSHPSLFRLSAPCSKGELASAVNMLLQMRRMRREKRSPFEKQAVDEAKVYLIRAHGMTEPEAHHFLQRGAMNHGMRLAEYAAKLLENK